MAQRTVALCDGKYIGVEIIYTVVNGQQINIPKKLKELREKSQKNELFCPCCCGANLILVAGDKNLREQHFRVKNGTGSQECKMPTESKTSVDSKIVLKCWLDDKLKASDIESRVPIYTIDDTARKPEFTFLSREKNYAIRYWRERANIINDKVEVLEGNSLGIKILYVVDAANGGSDGQYPEALMKLQDKQGYCLLMSIKEAEYDKASMKAVFYAKDNDGLWREVSFAEGLLKDYSLDDNHDVVIGDQLLEQLFRDVKDNFHTQLKEEKQRRVEAEKRRAENLRKIQEEKERRRLERQRRQEEAEKRLQLQVEEAKRCWLELEEKRKQELDKQKEEKRQREEDFKRNMESNFSQQETQVRDADGNRWIKCEFCGKIAKEEGFNSYGGVGHVNLGTCKECSANNPRVKEKLEEKVCITRKKYDPNICPDCGGTLREKSGQFGSFIGCSNYPRCRYTRNVRN